MDCNPNARWGDTYLVHAISTHPPQGHTIANLVDRLWYLDPNANFRCDLEVWGRFLSRFVLAIAEALELLAWGFYLRYPRFHQTLE